MISITNPHIIDILRNIGMTTPTNSLTRIIVVKKDNGGQQDSMDDNTVPQGSISNDIDDLERDADELGLDDIDDEDLEVDEDGLELDEVPDGSSDLDELDEFLSDDEEDESEEEDEDDFEGWI